MPSTLISIRRAWPVVQRRAIIEAVHQALVEALKIPAEDRCLRLQQLPADDFDVAPGQTRDFTLVEIDLFAGRSPAAKKALYQAIVRNLGKLGIAPGDVKILLRESPPQDWGIRGGVPASEVQLGFKVDV
jgi:phenylpyruvate tautomerase PptA (4-oxalocrotonate tautomerase family)